MIRDLLVELERSIEAAKAARKARDDARAENECFQAGHPLNGDRCACGLVRFAEGES